jgi:Holliday junction resolvase-like predicted endonuclease
MHQGNGPADGGHDARARRPRVDCESMGRGATASRLMRRAWRHLAADGAAVAIAFIVRSLRRNMRAWRRDPGERAAERFLRALGYRVLARNWRSPRDARDEADLVAASPDGSAIAIVEVKRAAGPWDPLERVDARKRAVLWRLAGDAVALRDGATRSRDRRIARAVRTAAEIRVDLVAVRGEGRTASATAHVVGIATRRVPVRKTAADQFQ